MRLLTVNRKIVYKGTNARVSVIEGGLSFLNDKFSMKYMEHSSDKTASKNEYLRIRKRRRHV